jgi:hypothetical protein
MERERQELRLTSDQFGECIENKRHLVSMLIDLQQSTTGEGNCQAAAASQPPLRFYGGMRKAKKHDNMW